jgi:hypothetical protein
MKNRSPVFIGTHATYLAQTNPGSWAYGDTTPN